MREIQILGLAAKYANPLAIKGEIWTLNDFYASSCYGMNPPFPFFRPARVFQTHGPETMARTLENEEWLKSAQEKNRWSGDWKKIYNQWAEKSITLYEIEGLENQEVFDVKRAQQEFGSWCLTSTISYMLIQAFWENIDVIRMNACPMLMEGYSFQMPGAWLLIENLRAMGIFIHNPYESVWLEMLDGFNWREFKKIDKVYGFERIRIPDLYHPEKAKLITNDQAAMRLMLQSKGN